MQRPMTKAGTTKLIGQSSKSHSRPNLEPVEVETSGNGPDSEVPEEQWPRMACLSVGRLSQQGHVIREVLL